jgi:hypothetical protein
MTEKRAYSYTILRYVHDVAAGEALNVGIVMYVPSAGFLQGKTRKTIGRLKQVFPDLDRHAFVEAMRAVDRALRSIDKQVTVSPLLESQADARTHALKLLPDDDSALQWSAVRTGLTAAPAKTFAQLYERYVARYDQEAPRRRSDDDVWRPVREKLLERDVYVPFESKVVAGPQDRIVFEKAWENGRWHAYEPVSFDLADAEGIKDKARRWRGHLSAVAEGSGQEINLHFVVGGPQNKSLLSAYRTAKLILHGAPFATEVVDENELEAFVTALEGEIRAHQKEASQ